MREKCRDFLRGDIIEKGRAHLCNSPEWPVLKPNSQYRLTIDYRHLSKFSSKMHEVLPDAEEVINRITARNS